MIRPVAAAVAAALAATLPGWAGGAALAQDAAQGQVRALVEAKRHAVLSAEIPGRIARLGVEAGQGFKAGEVLIAFDCASYQAELDAARAQLNAAEVTARVNRKLNSLRSIGEAEVQLAEAKAQVARADVRKYDVQAKRCEIRAPFDGRAVERRIQEHESVPAGAPLLEILSDRDLKVELIVPSSWLVWLKPGQRFDLRVDETGASLPGEVVQPGAKVDPASQSVKVTARLLGDNGPATGLTAGMSGTAVFPLQALSSLPAKPAATP
ncbi:RND family efflux transporter MFP subunit [Azospirillum agricola]|uniref:efflux RND transporter periplasmic adaptor subunit n=1 Tax=Azospirillum agricola TaxID=1720247 RepID=UPI002D7FD085|nr:efflux RND transporter periplasmic adaptor subunit [Azospirillum agricola]MBP2231000.1 RND family efflux transporter MFP subunit [Azospirillum agricola]